MNDRVFFLKEKIEYIILNYLFDNIISLYNELLLLAAEFYLLHEFQKSQYMKDAALFIQQASVLNIKDDILKQLKAGLLCLDQFEKIKI
jgi:hypothetical protein